MSFKEMWVRAIAALLLWACLGTGVMAAVRHDPWNLGVAALLGLVGLGFAVLSLHERP